MMGRRDVAQGRLFYGFNLDDHVPREHLLRGIDRYFDLGDLREQLAPFYSHTGRPSIDPELMISRAVREYLEAVEQANSADDEDDEPPAPPPKNVSLTDPASRWTAAPGGPAFFANSTNHLIDVEAGMILDVEATPAHRTDEVESTKTMVDRVEARFGLKPKRLVGDTAYGTAPMLGWMDKDKDIAPHVPVWDRSERKDGTLSSNESRGTSRPMSTAAPKDMRC